MTYASFSKRHLKLFGIHFNTFHLSMCDCDEKYITYCTVVNHYELHTFQRLLHNSESGNNSNYTIFNYTTNFTNQNLKNKMFLIVIQ